MPTLLRKSPFLSYRWAVKKCDFWFIVQYKSWCWLNRFLKSPMLLEASKPSSFYPRDRHIQMLFLFSHAALWKPQAIQLALRALAFVLFRYVGDYPENSWGGLKGIQLSCERRSRGHQAMVHSGRNRLFFKENTDFLWPLYLMSWDTRISRLA